MSPAAEQSSGAVESLWRYPVKSMAGEEVDASEVSGRGLVGDRAYAVIDNETGKVASAKNPRKWPELLSFGAAFAKPPRPGAPLPEVSITLPDGTGVTSGQPDVDAALSRALHRHVRLRAAEPTSPNPRTARAEEYWPDLEGLDYRDTVTDFDLPEGTFFDVAVVHVLTTATLSRLGELYPQGRMATRRFRPNIVLDVGGAAGFVENEWVGRTLHIGAQVQLAINEPCPRCVMITLPQGDLPKDSGILRTAAQHNKTFVGVYASVLRGGQIRRGDSITVR
ncbi:MAG: MOSC N-terminal beta barrel domain-containing protein [Frankiaceae bacterium]